MKTSIKLTLVAAFLATSVSLNSCQKDSSAPINYFSIQDDKDLGAKVKAEIESNPQEYPILSKTQYASAYADLERIAGKVLNSGVVTYREEFDWDMQIIGNDSVLNAFCTPGGHIYVYTGLIKYLDSEEQLAGVLGHEIAHADRRHTTSQLTKAYGVELLLSLILGTDESLLKSVIASLSSLKYSRDDESDADKYSVNYMCPTDYDARGVARFFEKLLAGGQGNNGPEFLSTHPSPEHRVQDIMAYWQTKGCTGTGTYPDLYQQFKSKLP